MTPYNIAVLLFVFGTLALGIFALVRRKDPVCRAFLIFGVLMAAWGTCYSLVISDLTNDEQALLCVRLAHVFAVISPAAWLHFVLAFVDKAATKFNSRFILGSYAYGVLFTPVTFLPQFISHVRPIENFSHYAEHGPLYHLFSIQYLIIAGYGCFVVIKTFTGMKGAIRNRTIALVLATLIGFIGTGVTFLPVYGLPFPYQAMLILPLYPFVMAWALHPVK